MGLIKDNANFPRHTYVKCTATLAAKKPLTEFPNS